jgi:hypothetical protein
MSKTLSELAIAYEKAYSIRNQKQTTKSKRARLSLKPVFLLGFAKGFRLIRPT